MNYNQFLMDDVGFLNKAYQSQYSNRYKNEPPSPRGLFSRAIDALNVGQYVSAGAALGMVDEDSTVIGNVAKGAYQSISSLVPFAKGKDEWKFSYSDVLTEAGWNPEGTGGKIGKFGLGMALDIYLDPMTYISGGVTGAIKGTGQAGAKAAMGAESVADLLGDSAKFADGIKDVNKSVKMTKEVAESIVTNSTYYKSGMEVVDVAKDADMLMTRFNKLIGINDKAADVTIGLANAPFGKWVGKKLFGEHGAETLTLIDGDVVKAFGDKTIAPAFGALRNSIYGGKIGELFIPSHPIFRTGKDNPELVYDFFKSIQLEQGLSADKQATARMIRKKGKEMLNLTPKEADEVREVMENKVNFNKIKKMMGFEETEEAVKYKEKIINAKKATEEKIEKIIQDPIDVQSEIDNVLFRNKSNDDMIKILKEERVKDLLDIDNRFAQEAGKLDEVGKTTKEVAESLKPLQKDNKAVIDKWKVFEASKKQASIDNEAAQELKKAVTKPKDVIVQPGDVLKEVLDDETLAFYEKLDKKSTPSGTWNRYKKSLKEEGFLTFKRKGAFDVAHERLGEEWVKSYMPDGSMRLYPPNAKVARQGSDVLIEKVTPKQLKVDMIDTLSEHIFGKKGFISYDTYDGNIEEVIKMLDNGDTQEQVIDHMLSKKDFYNGKANHMYEYISSKVKGYGKGTPYPGWQQYYTERVKDMELKKLRASKDRALLDKLMSTPGGQKIMKEQNIYEHTIWNPQMELDLAELYTKNLKREYMKSLFAEADTAQKVERIISDLQDVDFDELVYLEYGEEARAIARGEFNINDFMDKASKSSMKRQYQKGEVAGEVFKIGGKEREEVINYLVDDDVAKHWNTKKYPKTAKNIEDIAKYDELLEKNVKLRDTITMYEDKIKRIHAKKDFYLEETIEGKIIPRAYTDKGFSLEKTIDGKKVVTINPKYTKELEEVSKQVAKLRTDRTGIIQEADKLKNGVLADFRLRKTPPVADDVIERIANDGVTKTSEQLFQINESQFLTRNIESLKETARVERLRLIEMEGKVPNEVLFKERKLSERKLASIDEQIKMTIKERAKINKELADGINKLRYEPSKYDLRVHNGVVDKVEEILPKQFKKEFWQLTDEEKAKAIQMGQIEYRKSIEKANKIDPHEIIKEKAMGEITKRSSKAIKDVKLKTEPTSLNDLAYNSKMYSDFLTRQQDLVKMAVNEESLSKLDKLDDVTKAAKELEIEKVTSRYDEMISNIEKISLKNEETLKELKIKMEEFDPKEVEKLSKQIKGFNETLENADNFETFVRATEGDDVVDEIIRKYNSDAGDYLLNDKVEIGDRSQELVEQLRKEFIRIGQAEVDVGKMTQGQFDANKLDYLPHILTKEGKEAFANNKKFKDTLNNFGDASGFGREFNEFGKTRTIKVIPDGHGGWIDKPSIREINDFFRETMGGKDVFKEDLSEIYVARAIKHNDLMYDNKYMENMNELFGEAYDGVIKKDHNLAINYGKLKQTTGTVAKGHQSLDISEAVGKYLNTESVRRAIEVETSVRMGNNISDKLQKKINHEVVGEFIKDYMENKLTGEVRSQMYNHRLNEFVTKTGTTRMLDDIATPLAGIDDKQYNSINESVGALRKRYEEHIRKRAKSLFGLTKDAHSAEFEDMPISKMKDKLTELMKSEHMDDIDKDRVSRVLRRIKEMEEIGDPKITQMPNAIFERANRTRQVQIMKDQNKFLQMYDNFTHFIKVNQTAVSPAFHVRNKTSNLFQSSLGIGKDAVDMDLQRDAMQAMKFAEGKDGITDKLYKWIDKSGNEQEMLWSELYQHALDYGAIDEGYFAKEVGGFISKEGKLKKFGVPGKYDITDMENFIAYKAGTKVGSTVENHDRLIHFVAQVKNGMGYEQAAESVNKFMFDYGDLTSFEMNVMKRIFPYYTWMRKNAPLQLEMMLEHPDRYRMIGKVMGGIENMVDEEDRIDKRYVSDFAQDWLQVPFFRTNEDGRREPILLNPNLPFMDINRIPDVTRPIDSARDLFTQMNPILKVPVELAANKDFFFNKQIAKRYDKDYYKPSEKYLPKYAGHIAKQFAVTPIVDGVVNKTGLDLGLHLLNNTTGIKFMSYDADKQKAIKINQLEKKRQNSNSNPGILDSINRRLSR